MQCAPCRRHDIIQRQIDRADGRHHQAAAAAKGCAPAQLAIAWLLHQSNRIIPIPGTRRIATLDEHLGAAEVTLSAQDLSAIRDALPPGAAVGARYPESAQTGLNG